MNTTQIQPNVRYPAFIPSYSIFINDSLLVRHDENMIELRELETHLEPFAFSPSKLFGIPSCSIVSVNPLVLERDYLCIVIMLGSTCSVYLYDILTHRWCLLVSGLNAMVADVSAILIDKEGYLALALTNGHLALYQLSFGSNWTAKSSNQPSLDTAALSAVHLQYSPVDKVVVVFYGSESGQLGALAISESSQLKRLSAVKLPSGVMVHMIRGIAFFSTFKILVTQFDPHEATKSFVSVYELKPKAIQPQCLFVHQAEVNGQIVAASPISNEFLVFATQQGSSHVIRAVQWPKQKILSEYSIESDHPILDVRGDHYGCTIIWPTRLSTLSYQEPPSYQDWYLTSGKAQLLSSNAYSDKKKIQSIVNARQLVGNLAIDHLLTEASVPTQLYPPVDQKTLEQLHDLILGSTSVNEERRFAILLYLVLDAGLNDEMYAINWGLPHSEWKLIKAYWNMDHGKVKEAVLIFSECHALDHPAFVLNSLWKHDLKSTMMLYYLFGSQCDPRTCMKLLLAHDVTEAYFYHRETKGSLKREFFDAILNACFNPPKLPQMKRFIKELPLEAHEIDQFTDFVCRSTITQVHDLYIGFCISRLMYERAIGHFHALKDKGYISACAEFVLPLELVVKERDTVELQFEYLETYQGAIQEPEMVEEEFDQEIIEEQILEEEPPSPIERQTSMDLVMESPPRSQKSHIVATPTRISPVIANSFLDAPTTHTEVESISVASSTNLLQPPVAPLIPLKASTELLKTPPTEKPRASILTSPVGRKMLTASLPLVSMSPFSPRKEVDRPSRVISPEISIEDDSSKSNPVEQEAEMTIAETPKKIRGSRRKVTKEDNPREILIQRSLRNTPARLGRALDVVEEIVETPKTPQKTPARKGTRKQLVIEEAPSPGSIPNPLLAQTTTPRRVTRSTSNMSQDSEASVSTPRRITRKQAKPETTDKAPKTPRSRKKVEEAPQTPTRSIVTRRMAKMMPE